MKKKVFFFSLQKKKNKKKQQKQKSKKKKTKSIFVNGLPLENFCRFRPSSSAPGLLVLHLTQKQFLQVLLQVSLHFFLALEGVLHTVCLDIFF